MISFKLDYQVKGNDIKNFLLGSKKLFDKVAEIIHLLGMAIDVETNTTFKLSEIERSSIAFDMDIHFNYPQQGYLWGSLNKSAIDTWITGTSREILSLKDPKIIVKNIEELGRNLGFDNNCIYLKNYSEILTISLDDLKNMSILLFNNLVL